MQNTDDNFLSIESGRAFRALFEISMVTSVTKNQTGSSVQSWSASDRVYLGKNYLRTSIIPFVYKGVCRTKAKYSQLEIPTCFFPLPIYIYLQGFLFDSGVRLQIRVNFMMSTGLNISENAEQQISIYSKISVVSFELLNIKL